MKSFTSKSRWLNHGGAVLQWGAAPDSETIASCRLHHTAFPVVKRYIETRRPHLQYAWSPRSALVRLSPWRAALSCGMACKASESAL